MKVKVFALLALLCGAMFGVTSCTDEVEPDSKVLFQPSDDIIDEETPL